MGLDVKLDFSLLASPAVVARLIAWLFAVIAVSVLRSVEAACHFKLDIGHTQDSIYIAVGVLFAYAMFIPVRLFLEVFTGEKDHYFKDVFLAIFGVLFHFIGSVMLFVDFGGGDGDNACTTIDEPSCCSKIRTSATFALFNVFILSADAALSYRSLLISQDEIANVIASPAPPPEATLGGPTLT